MADLRRRLPAVDLVLGQTAVAALVPQHGRSRVTDWIRAELATLRHAMANDTGEADPLTEVVQRTCHRAIVAERSALGRVVNATGVVLHTGLGRAPLSKRAIEAMRDIAGGGNVEIDLVTGERRHRGHQLLPALRRLTGCEDAVVVNNNAAATLLVLASLCRGREVVISRGQLIEIGGSFRLPEIFELGGVTLREVGTTNRTTPDDYERAITPGTAAILRVHPSNYRIEGFTASPEIESLVPLARAYGLLCIDDIGSGCLVDTTRFGLPAEPTFRRSVTAGADIVLGSGDKLLGGPQAGLVIGRAEALATVRRHPYARTVRTDKLTLAALDATLEAYVHERELEEIPVLAMLAASVQTLQRRAENVIAAVGATSCRLSHRAEVATIGGGSLPGAELPTWVVVLECSGHSSDDIARSLRTGSPRVVPRVRDAGVLLDLRSVAPEDDDALVTAIRRLDRSRDECGPASEGDRDTSRMADDGDRGST